MFDRRPGLQADWPRVFAEAAVADIAVEIDAHPYRQDLEVELLQAAREAGVRISIGTDAHHPDELSHMGYGLAAALRAGVPRERILNFASVDDVLAWTRARRPRN
jgi:DNA polymerase (family 10)